MQIATFNYRYKPKDNVNGEKRARLRHRHTFTTITSTPKISKPRQSLYSEMAVHSNGQLPPIVNGNRRRTSIKIQGSSLPSSKLGEASALSFQQRSRSLSQQSITSEHLDLKSPTVSPTGIIRSTSRLNRMKFGHPVKVRPVDFYGPDKSGEELQVREESFVNDSVRAAHQNRRASIIPPYEALDDPHLRQFFQSPLVLDVVRKTLNVDSNNLYKPDDRSLTIKKRSKSNDTYDKHNDDYRRIVSKGSSGYAKLNGYDCIPTHSPGRRFPSRLNTTDAITSSSQNWNLTDSRLNQLTGQDKNRTSTNASSTSFTPINSNQIEKHERQKKTQKYDKPKQTKPVTRSSSFRHPVRDSVEAATTNTESSSTTKVNGYPSEQKHDTQD